MIFINLTIIFHLEPFPNDLETRKPDLDKIKSTLPVSTLSIAWGPKFMVSKPLKGLFLVVKEAF